MILIPITVPCLFITRIASFSPLNEQRRIEKGSGRGKTFLVKK